MDTSHPPAAEPAVDLTYVSADSPLTEVDEAEVAPSSPPPRQRRRRSSPSSSYTQSRSASPAPSRAVPAPSISSPSSSSRPPVRRSSRRTRRADPEPALPSTENEDRELAAALVASEGLAAAGGATFRPKLRARRLSRGSSMTQQTTPSSAPLSPLQKTPTIPPPPPPDLPSLALPQPTARTPDVAATTAGASLSAQFATESPSMSKRKRKTSDTIEDEVISVTNTGGKERENPLMNSWEKAGLKPEHLCKCCQDALVGTYIIDPCRHLVCETCVLERTLVHVSQALNPIPCPVGREKCSENLRGIERWEEKDNQVTAILKTGLSSSTVARRYHDTRATLFNRRPPILSLLLQLVPALRGVYYGSPLKPASKISERIPFINPPSTLTPHRPPDSHTRTATAASTSSSELASIQHAPRGVPETPIVERYPFSLAASRPLPPAQPQYPTPQSMERASSLHPPPDTLIWTGKLLVPAIGGGLITVPVDARRLVLADRGSNTSNSLPAIPATVFPPILSLAGYKFHDRPTELYRTMPCLGFFPAQRPLSAPPIEMDTYMDAPRVLYQLLQSVSERKNKVLGIKLPHIPDKGDPHLFFDAVQLGSDPKLVHLVALINPAAYATVQEVIRRRASPLQPPSYINPARFNIPWPAAPPLPFPPPRPAYNQAYQPYHLPPPPPNQPAQFSPEVATVYPSHIASGSHYVFQPPESPSTYIIRRNAQSAGYTPQLQFTGGPGYPGWQPSGAGDGYVGYYSGPPPISNEPPPPPPTPTRSWSVPTDYPDKPSQEQPPGPSHSAPVDWAGRPLPPKLVPQQQQQARKARASESHLAVARPSAQVSGAYEELASSTTAMPPEKRNEPLPPPAPDAFLVQEADLENPVLLSPEAYTSSEHLRTLGMEPRDPNLQVPSSVAEDRASTRTGSLEEIAPQSVTGDVGGTQQYSEAAVAGQQQLRLPSPARLLSSPEEEEEDLGAWYGPVVTTVPAEILGREGREVRIERCKVVAELTLDLQTRLVPFCLPETLCFSAKLTSTFATTVLTTPASRQRVGVLRIESHDGLAGQASEAAVVALLTELQPVQPRQVLVNVSMIPTSSPSARGQKVLFHLRPEEDSSGGGGTEVEGTGTGVSGQPRTSIVADIFLVPDGVATTALEG